MNATRILSNSVYLIVAWAGLMLSLAEGRIIPVPLTLPIVFFAWALERIGKARLPGWLAAFLGLAAFGVSVLEFTFGDIESRLLSIAHVIVYLTWIVMFMKKGRREYWLLLALALLQIAVGAVLTIEGWYGAMLLVSLVLMLWTLAVFCFHTAHSEYASVGLVRVSGNGKPAADDPFRIPGASSGASQIDPGESWLGKRFRRTLLKSLIATGLLAGVVFASVPRIWIGNPIADVAMKAGREQSIALTGYSNTVRLGEMGTILESDEPVLQVRLFDVRTGERINMDKFAEENGMDEPLFRGTVMTTYKDGEWEKAEAENFVAVPLVQRDVVGASVRQEITLEPTTARLMFVLSPFIAISIEDERMQARVGRETGAVHYPRGRRYARRYTVISPDAGTRRFDGWRRTPTRWRKHVCDTMYLKVPSSLTRLRALAATVAGTSVGLDPHPADQAQSINAYLNNTDLFKYSLTGVRMDRNLDPIEDFLLNHRTGNCEFFASAMTLMLRSQNIPARLVTGFKGGYTNGIDGTFEVQKMHAHTWVEAYIGGQWQTFDPTPAARSETVAAMAPGIRSLTDLRMWLNGMWSRLIVNLSLDEQKTKLYDPMARQFRTFTRAISGKAAGGWKTAFSRQTWYSVPGAIVGLTITALVLFPLRRRILSLLKRLLRRAGVVDAEPDRERQIIRFYEKFREICAEHGRTRERSETDREFASAVQAEWSGRLEATELRTLPRQLADEFYGLRFGHTSLEHVDVTDIERQLSAFAEQLRVTAPIR